MPRIAIVYHSSRGHTERVAQFVADGVREAGAEVSLLTSAEATARLDELDDADAIVFGCPTFMGGPSAEFKAFMDATGRKWYAGAWRDKVAAGFTNSGGYAGDKQTTLIAFATLAMQHGMVWVGVADIPQSNPSGHGAPPEAVNRLGSFTGLMTQSDDAPADRTPSPGDIETARRFGRRVAEAAGRWAAGRTHAGERAPGRG